MAKKIKMDEPEEGSWKTSCVICEWEGEPHPIKGDAAREGTAHWNETHKSEAA